MSSRVNQIVKAAQRDRKLLAKLREIVDLDSKLMPRGIVVIREHSKRMQTREYQQMAQRLSNLCDEVAVLVSPPNASSSEIEEMAMWISYNCQQIGQQLPRKRWLW